MNWKVVCLALVLGSGSWQAGHGQEYRFRWYGNAEGLGSLAVRSFQTDGRGFVWALTDNGVYRFDGERFEPFGARRGLTSEPDAIGAGPDGELIASTRKGLFRFGGHHFAKIHDLVSVPGLVQGIHADGAGCTYVGTPQGLARLRSDGRGGYGVDILPATAGKAINGVLADGASVWFGCGNQLHHLDAKGHLKVYGREAGLPEAPILSLRKDGAGHLWACAQNQGVFQLPAGQDRFIRPETPVDPRLLRETLNVDAEGRILIPSSSGLLIGDPRGWRLIGRSNGLQGQDQVFATMEDPSHTLWLGMIGRGAAQWRGYQRWETWTTDSGLPSDGIWEILPEPGGTVWAGTIRGLARGKKGTSGITWSRVEAIGSVTVHSVVRGPDGGLWLGTEGKGVARYAPASGRLAWIRPMDGVPESVVLVLRFDRQGRMWLGTQGGVFRAEAPYKRFTRIQEIGATPIWNLAEGGDGRIWAAGPRGLHVLDGGTWRTFTKADGLGNNGAEGLAPAPGGAMWISYEQEGGIDRVRLDAGRLLVEKALHRPGTRGSIYWVAPDALGQVWAGTEHGVDVWNGRQWSHFDSEDGLAWNDCDLNAFAAEPDGTVWIGTSGGLSRMTPRRLPAPAPARVAWTRVATGPDEVDPDGPRIVAKHAAPVALHYALLNATPSRDTRFRYRLDGPDAPWTETRQRELTFPRLVPGTYRIEVQGQLGDGTWTAQPAVLHLKVLAPWYRTWWFTGICLGALGLLAAAVVRFRLLLQRAREQKLQRLVDHRTEELRKANEELAKLSTTDGLTGVCNRRFFDQTLQREWARCLRTNEPLSLLLIDIDHFKLLNDSEGHPRGDECLKAVAAAIRQRARRETDVVARYGGEEFVLVLPCTALEDAVALAGSIREGVRGLELGNPTAPTSPILTVSIGAAAAVDRNYGSAEQLLLAVDQALYEAKHRGRDRVVAAGRPN